MSELKPKEFFVGNEQTMGCIRHQTDFAIYSRSVNQHTQKTEDVDLFLTTQQAYDLYVDLGNEIRKRSNIV